MRAINVENDLWKECWSKLAVNSIARDLSTSRSDFLMPLVSLAGTQYENRVDGKHTFQI